MRKYLLLLIFIVSSPHLSFAHGGGLDANGGHYNRRSGEYHYHRRQPAQMSPPSSVQKTSKSSAEEAPAQGTSPRQTQPAQTRKSAGMADEIKKLYELYKQGILSKEEYEQGKRKFLE